MPPIPADKGGDATATVNLAAPRTGFEGTAASPQMTGGGERGKRRQGVVMTVVQPSHYSGPRTRNFPITDVSPGDNPPHPYPRGSVTWRSGSGCKSRLFVGHRAQSRDETVGIE